MLYFLKNNYYGFIILLVSCVALWAHFMCRPFINYNSFTLHYIHAHTLPCKGEGVGEKKTHTDGDRDRSRSETETETDRETNRERERGHREREGGRVGANCTQKHVRWGKEVS